MFIHLFVVSLTYQTKTNKDMTQTEKLKALTNGLKNITKNECLFIKTDEIHGKTFAIAKMLAGGVVSVKTNFMDYDGMNCFFFGVMAVKENRKNINL